MFYAEKLLCRSEIANYECKELPFYSCLECLYLVFFWLLIVKLIKTSVKSV